MADLKFFTAAEVAPLLRTTVYAVTEACRRGELKATKPGRAWLIEQADLEEYLTRFSNRAENGAADEAEEVGA